MLTYKARSYSATALATIALATSITGHGSGFCSLESRALCMPLQLELADASERDPSPSQNPPAKAAAVGPSSGSNVVHLIADDLATGSPDIGRPGLTERSKTI